MNAVPGRYQGGDRLPTVASMDTSPPQANRWPKLPASATPIVFAFYMSAIMAFLMCTVIVGVNTGWAVGLLSRILQSYILAMPVAFVCVLAVRPLVMALVRHTVQAPR